jgi:phage gp36-like protein
VPYCVQADVQTAAGGAKRLAQLVDWDGDATVDSAEVTAAIASADALINRYAARRYTVPMTPVPEGAKRMSADLAVRMLKKWRGVLDENDAKAQEADIAWLDKMADGAVVWDVDPEPAKHSRVRDDYHERSSDKDMSREKSKGFW